MNKEIEKINDSIGYWIADIKRHVIEEKQVDFNLRCFELNKKKTQSPFLTSRAADFWMEMHTFTNGHSFTVGERTTDKQWSRLSMQKS